LLVVSIPAVLTAAALTLATLEVRAPSAVVPGDEEITHGERVPLSPDAERAALQRRFQPRDEREALAFARLREGARHEKQHEMDLVRDRVVWALSIAADDEVVAPLVAQLASPDWRVRSYAAWCLGVVGPADAGAELTAALADPVWRVRAMAATALAALGDRRATEDMRRLLEDPHWQVRLPAVQYLGRIGTPETLAAVRGRLDDPHVAVRSAAQSALDGGRLIED
jgi:HEAT repeat protein